VHGIEGVDTGEWILVDLGAVVVHIMQPATRLYYNLEELWGGAAAAPRQRAAGRARQ
jgi:ribosome-associated protein